MIRSSDHPILRSSTAWGLTDGSAGMVAQVQALAAALGVVPEMKKIVLRHPWDYLPAIAYASPLRPLIVPYFIVGSSVALTPPYPELVISCGRRAAVAVMGLRQGMAATKFIHIQDPRVSPKHFDLVVAMEHDKITGPNVLKTRFALHAITPAVLGEARQQFAPRFAEYIKPLVAVLIGGSTNKYRLSTEAMRQVIASLQAVLDHSPCSLLITPSRRTGAENIALLRQAFAGNPRVYIYDFTGENPYLGLLALAECIIVTNDSVNMMSEAYATGKPMYVLPSSGHADTKPMRFAQMLMREGIARPLEGTLEAWGYKVENEMEGLVDKIKQAMPA